MPKSKRPRPIAMALALAHVYLYRLGSGTLRAGLWKELRHGARRARQLEPVRREGAARGARLRGALRAAGLRDGRRDGPAQVGGPVRRRRRRRDERRAHREPVRDDRVRAQPHSRLRRRQARHEQDAHAAGHRVEPARRAVAAPLLGALRERERRAVPGERATARRSPSLSETRTRASASVLTRVAPRQCSPLSTARAIAHQHAMAVRYQEHAENTVVVLLLDEVGLAEHSPDTPLKVRAAIRDIRDRVKPIEPPTLP